MKVIKNCLLGLYLILQSLSGTFSLITLFVIAGVTYCFPSIGCGALAAFATVIPAILAYAEHKEQLQTVMYNNQPPTIKTVVDNLRGQL